MLYKNPYADRKDFIDLGIMTHEDIDGVHHADLYVLANNKQISFGAKYGPEEHDYMSGICVYTADEWHIIGGWEIQTAAARYFANHYQMVRPAGE